MKIIKSRPFIAAICLVFALFFCFYAVPKQSKSLSEQTEIVRVTDTIRKGTKIEEKHLETIKVGGYNLPDNVIKKSSQVIGKYANADLQKGDYILATKISNQPSDSIYLNQLHGKQALSVSIKSFATGLSGKLQYGDIISFSVGNYGSNKATFDPPELQYVKVLAVTTDEGADKDVSVAKNDDKSDENLPTTITLLVVPKQKIKLVDYENNGILHASLVYRGNDSSAQKYLDAQDAYLSGGAKNG